MWPVAWLTRNAKPLTVALLCFVAMLSCMRDRDSGGKVRTELPLHLLRDGDLLLRCGVGASSQAVIEIDKNKGMYTHIGIAISENGTWKVVHAVPGESANGIDLVKVEPVDTFFLTTRATRGAAMRLQHCDSATAHRAAMWARDCARRGVPFDDRYNWHDRSRLYCTELVQAAYESVGIDLASDKCSTIDLPLFKGEVVFPSDMARCDSLMEIFRF